MIARIALQALASWAAFDVLFDVAAASEAGLLQLIGLPIAIAIFARDRGDGAADPRWRAASTAALLAYAISIPTLPRLVGVLFALASLGALLAAHVRKPAGAFGLFALVCSAVPIADVLQAVIGGPMREAVSAAAACLLRGSGLGVESDGVLLVEGARAVLVDPACSGLRFLACASLLACSLAAWMRLGVGATVALLALSIPATFVANVLRVSSLFFLERANLAQAGPSFLHAGVGLVAFALACLGLIWAASRIRGPHAVGRSG